jgi:hypothetical protein
VTLSAPEARKKGVRLDAGNERGIEKIQVFNGEDTPRFA